jgi:hypothetical protein
MSNMSECYVLYKYSNSVSIHYDFKCKWTSERIETLSLQYSFTTSPLNQSAVEQSRERPHKYPGGYPDQPPWKQCFALHWCITE